jgi:H+-transporting ATPase
LSAAQVGIAVEGATDAAKNAADLILTKPGLQPIYGAVLESRRIFARIKCYVVYRVAASLVMVLTLSTIIFASGCAVDPLLVIILALLNDISMIPVAYDNAKATTKPQLPNARKLVLMALFYGIMQSTFSLLFVFLMDYAQDLANPIEITHYCDQETQGFIWFNLVLNTELMIFSVRAPGFLLFSAPSIYLFASVLATCIATAFIAVYSSGLHGMNVLFIVLFNLAALMVVDILKIFFRKLLNDAPGDVIETDDLLEAAPLKKTETEKHLEKQLRYVVHRESVLAPEDRQHVVQVRETATSGLETIFDMSPTTITDGYVNRNLTQRQKALETHGGPQRRKQHSTAW